MIKAEPTENLKEGKPALAEGPKEVTGEKPKENLLDTLEAIVTQGESVDLSKFKPEEKEKYQFQSSVNPQNIPSQQISEEKKLNEVESMMIKDEKPKIPEKQETNADSKNTAPIETKPDPPQTDEKKAEVQTEQKKIEEPKIIESIPFTQEEKKQPLGYCLY